VRRATLDATDASNIAHRWHYPPDTYLGEGRLYGMGLDIEMKGITFMCRSWTLGFRAVIQRSSGVFSWFRRCFSCHFAVTNAGSLDEQRNWPPLHL